MSQLGETLSLQKAHHEQSLRAEDRPRNAQSAHSAHEPRPHAVHVRCLSPEVELQRDLALQLLHGRDQVEAQLRALQEARESLEVAQVVAHEPLRVGVLHFHRDLLPRRSPHGSVHLCDRRRAHGTLEVDALEVRLQVAAQLSLDQRSHARCGQGGHVVVQARETRRVRRGHEVVSRAEELARFQVEPAQRETEIHHARAVELVQALQSILQPILVD